MGAERSNVGGYMGEKNFRECRIFVRNSIESTFYSRSRARSKSGGVQAGIEIHAGRGRDSRETEGV